MMKNAKYQRESEQVLRALLKMHDCPLKYHEVRARFMGNIASPDMEVTPMREIEAIWGGKMPAFKSNDEASLLINGLIGGIWNELSVHQNPKKPFRLMRVKAAPPSYEHLGKLAKFWREEIDGFMDGLMLGQEEIDMPQAALPSLEVLGEIRAMLEGIHQLCIAPPGPASTDSLAENMKHVHRMMDIAQLEINSIIQFCKEARARMFDAQEYGAPGTLH